MSKKPTDISININMDVADALGIKNSSDIEMILMEDVLIIRSKKKSKIPKKLESKRNAVTIKLMNEYESVLKKLAKT